MFSALRTAGLCIFMPVAASAGSVLPGISDLLWFGDSLSDPGNAFAASGGTTPDPTFYPDGQYTNGDTWAVQLGADLASGAN
jgi:phospholipase/lecithinase/hemolysin